MGGGIIVAIWLGFVAPALALTPGVYRMGSAYITIGSAGERFCYQGVSKNGQTTASLIKTKEGYRIHRWNDLIRQTPSGELDFGGAQYQRIGDVPENNPDMRACLKSTKPFFRQ